MKRFILGFGFGFVAAIALFDIVIPYIKGFFKVHSTNIQINPNAKPIDGILSSPPQKQ